MMGIVAWLVTMRNQSIEKVRNSAETEANDDPYCLQVNGGGEYREVRQLADISIFSMRVPSGGDGHHAILAIERIDGTELLHWSYRKQKFVSGVVGPPAIYCTPRPHFLTNINENFHPESRSKNIRVDRMYLSIPRSFHSKAMGNSRGIYFYATPPLFEALKTSTEVDTLPPIVSISSFIEVNFGKTGRQEVWLHKNDDSHKVENVGFETGLSKQLVWYLPSARKSPADHPFADYYFRLSNGQLQTLITCGTETGGDCHHTFYDNEWTYTFHHKKEFLYDWKGMQERLSSLAKSFVSSGEVISSDKGLDESHTVNKLTRPNTVRHLTP